MITSSVEEDLLNGLQGTIDALAGSSLDEAEMWASKLQVLVDDYQIEGEAGEEAEPEEAPAAPKPNEFAGQPLKCNGQDVAPQVKFVLVDRQVQKLG